jgi:predicted peptidase
MRALAPEETRRRHSEADVLAVADLVAAEYNVDPARTYLTGNSMGGAGTWWIGARHPQRWAAIAPAAFGGVEQDYVSGLAQLPILAVVGDRDELGMRDRVAESVALLRSNGLRPGYLEIPGGTHASGFDIALPQILDFFGQHRK